MTFIQRNTILIILSLSFLFACSSGHDHLDAEGLVLMKDGEEILRYEAPDAVDTPIVLEEGQTLSNVQVMFIDKDGRLFQPDNPEFNLQWSIRDNAIASFEKAAGEEWVINMTGLSAGQTEFQIEAFHIDHADFETVWFNLNVTAVE